MPETALYKAVDNLEGSVGFSGSRRHDKQDPVLPPCDGVKRAVDGNALVIPRRIGALARIVGLIDYFLLIRCQPFLFLVPLVKLIRRGKLPEGDLPLLPGNGIELLEGIPVRAVGKRNIKHPGIFLCLLHSVRYRMLIVLCLNYGNRMVRAEQKKIVGFLRSVALYDLSCQIDPACCDLRFHQDILILPLLLDCRSDVTELDVLFCQLGIVRHFPHSLIRCNSRIQTVPHLVSHGLMFQGCTKQCIHGNSRIGPLLYKAPPAA